LFNILKCWQKIVDERKFLKNVGRRLKKMLEEASKKMLTKKCWKKPPEKMLEEAPKNVD
jgi:hypothetical protein